MKKNIRVNISISPSVLEDARKIATDRFAGNVSAYIAALIDYDVKQRRGQKSDFTEIKLRLVSQSDTPRKINPVE